MLLAFEGMSRPVALDGCDELVQDIAAILRGWRVREVPASAAPSPLITIRKTARGYDRVSPWLSKPVVFRHKVDAICDFLVDLIRGYIADNRSLLCLHCAAVAFENRLLVFPSTYRAGKSTLSIHLAATGARLFGDDVLHIEGSNNNGVAPGILPRLRLPLPDGADDGSYEFVRHRSGPQSSRYLYVNLTDGELAPFGTSAPIHGFVLLQRDTAANPELIPASKGEILKHSILRNFSRNMSALDILDRLHAIVDGAECFTLRYATSEQAAALLRDAFGRKADTGCAG